MGSEGFILPWVLGNLIVGLLVAMSVVRDLKRADAMFGLRESDPIRFWAGIGFRVLITLATLYFAVFLFLPF
jgi:hypothetical protein